MVALKSFLLFCALNAQALAAAAPEPTCATALGPNSVKVVPTATTTVVEKITIVKKFIRKVKVIVVPRPKTTTVKITEYTTTTEIADAATQTATSVITSEQTEYSTSTSTSVITTDSTTYTTVYVTSTVPAPAGFTPILKDTSYVAKRKVRAIGNRAAAVNPLVTSAMYPQKVACTVKKPSYSTKTTTITAHGPQVTLKAATKTIMSTVYSTITTISYPPDVSTTTTTTVYPTTTSWTSTTSISTVTNTVTIESDIPRSTVYAACSSNNVLTTANNGGRVVAWKNVLPTDNLPSYLGMGFTPETCCNECQKRPFCRITLLDNSNNGACYIYVTGNSATCANGAQPYFGSYLTSSNAPQTPHWIYSNGPCGRLTNGGGA
ncbi:hypothetical protein HG531_005905 [Fusarium graminearum]|nr:hypothetical protein HG531_005905 [Fusarium graminearum]